jgi:hypothetical protein
VTDLICEGACNPTLPTFDRVAEFYAVNVLPDAKGRSRDDAATVFEILVSERMKLRHVLHRRLSSNRWACTVCGCERKYGAQDVSADWYRQKLGRTA